MRLEESSGVYLRARVCCSTQNGKPMGQQGRKDKERRDEKEKALDRKKGLSCWNKEYPQLGGTWNKGVLQRKVSTEGVGKMPHSEGTFKTVCLRQHPKKKVKWQGKGKKRTVFVGEMRWDLAQKQHAYQVEKRKRLRRPKKAKPQNTQTKSPPPKGGRDNVQVKRPKKD